MSKCWYYQVSRFSTPNLFLQPKLFVLQAHMILLGVLFNVLCDINWKFFEKFICFINQTLCRKWYRHVICINDSNVKHEISEEIYKEIYFIEFLLYILCILSISHYVNKIRIWIWREIIDSLLLYYLAFLYYS